MRWEFSTVLLWESLLGEEMECVSAGVSEPCVILSAGTAFSRSWMGPWCCHCSKWFLPVTLSQRIRPVTSQHWLVQEQRKRIGKCWGGGTGSTCRVLVAGALAPSPSGSELLGENVLQDSDHKSFIYGLAKENCHC